MASDFIQMLSDWRDIRYSQTTKRLASNKVPCGVFLNDVSKLQFMRNFFKKCNLNLNCICVMNKEDKKFEPADGEQLVALEEFHTVNPKPEFMFVLNGFFPLMFMDYFKARGTKMFFHNGGRNAEDTYDLYMKHLPELYEIHERLADDESKKSFRAYMTARVTDVLNDFRFAPEPQYFLEGFLPSKGDVAIDGGAFDGATSEDFARQGAQVYAFEMNAANYENCLARASKNDSGGGERYSFTIENFGLSNQENEASYRSGGAGSHKDPNGTLTAKFIDLDTYVLRKNLPRVDYIKLDIEGAELDMLHGAAKTITRYKPKMAISAYHRRDDLWTLANYVKSLRSDYEFKFRHYRIDCTDYLFNDSQREIFRSFGLSYFCPSNCEAVLYCK